jgi:hypothetical protein
VLDGTGRVRVGTAGNVLQRLLEFVVGGRLVGRDEGFIRLFDDRLEGVVTAGLDQSVPELPADPQLPQGGVDLAVEGANVGRGGPRTGPGQSRPRRPG